MEVGLQLGLQKIPRDVGVGMVGTKPARLGLASGILVEVEEEEVET